MFNKTKIESLICLLLVASATISTSQTTPVVYEPFDYADGAALDGKNGGTGFTTAWDTTQGASPTVQAASLSYGALLTSGGAAVADSADSSLQNFRSFETQRGTTWISFLIQSQSNTAGISLYNNNSESIFFGAINDGYSFRFQRQATGFDIVNTPKALFDNQDHFLVVQIDTSGARLVFNTWVNPDIRSLGTGAAPTGGTFTSVRSNATSLNYNRFRIGVFSGAQTAIVDELRIGTKWADVSPVSEPKLINEH